MNSSYKKQTETYFWTYTLYLYRQYILVLVRELLGMQDSGYPEYSPSCIKCITSVKMHHMTFYQ